MSVKRVFIDTNILVYAHDKDAGHRHKKASSLIMDVWEGEHHPVISIQVLQELLSVLLKKGIPLDAVDEVSEDYSAWTVIDNSLTLFREGMDIMRTCRISFWDAMIAAAAVQGKADELWTEDLNPGQKYGGVISVNPLA